MSQSGSTVGSWQRVERIGTSVLGSTWRARSPGLDLEGELHVLDGTGALDGRRAPSGSVTGRAATVLRATRVQGPGLRRILDSGTGIAGRRPGLELEAQVPWVVLEGAGLEAVGAVPSDPEELLQHLAVLLRGLVRCHHQGFVLGGLSHHSLVRDHRGELVLDLLAGPRVLTPGGRVEDLADLGERVRRWVAALSLDGPLGAWAQALHEERLPSAFAALAALRRAGVVLPDEPDLDGRAEAGSVCPAVLLGQREPALVGRRRERSYLEEGLRQVMEGRGSSVVILEGESGLGASRLATWLGTLAVTSGRARVHEVRHDLLPGPDHGIGRAIMRAHGLGGLPPAEAIRSLRRRLQELEGLDQGDVQGIEGLLRLRGAATGSGERAGVVARWLGAVGGGEPQVLLVRDIQWGAETVDLVARMLAEGGTGPLLVVMTCRSEELVGKGRVRGLLDSLPHGPAGGRVQLAPLGRVELAELLQGGLGLDEEASTRVGALSRGKPIVAVEAVRTLVARSSLAPEAGRLALVGPSSGLASSAAGVLGERLEQVLQALDADQASAVEAAGVVGLVVRRPVWRAVCERLGGVGSRQLVLRLEEVGFAEGAVEGTIGEWRWRHPVLPTLLRRRASRARRLPLFHLACAEVIAQDGVRDLADVMAVAGHLRDAEEWGRAVTLVEEGLSRQLSRGDARAAAALVELGEELVSGRARGVGLRGRSALTLRSAELAMLRGELEAAHRGATRVLPAARKGGWRRLEAETRLLQAHVAWWRGEPQLADDLIYEAEVLGENLRDAEVLARCTLALAQISLACGRPIDARAHVTELLRAPPDQLSRIRRGRARRILANALLEELRPEAAEVEAGRADVLFEEVGSELEQAHMHLLRADLARLAGDAPASREHCTRARAGFEAVGSADGVLVSQRLALLAADEGDWREARRRAVSARSKMLELGMTPERVLCELVLAEAALGNGDVVGAMSSVGAAEEILDHVPINGIDARRRLAALEKASPTSALRGRVRELRSHLMGRSEKAGVSLTNIEGERD